MKKNIFCILTAALLCVLLTCSCAYAEETETDWYIEKADALREELALLCADSAYLAAYTIDDDMRTLAVEWSEAITAEPIRVSKYSVTTDLLIVGLMLNASGTLSETAVKHLKRAAGSTVLSMSCAREGSDFLAASSLLRINEGYIMPENFEPCLVLYEYENICVGVTFDQYGEGVVTATAGICPENIKQHGMSIGGADGVLTQDSSPAISLPDRTLPSGTGSKRGK